jgi:hypothetical protein
MGILENISNIWNQVNSLWDQIQQLWRRLTSLEDWLVGLSESVARGFSNLWDFLDERLGDLDQKIIAVVRVRLDELLADVWIVLDHVRRDLSNTADRLASVEQILGRLLKTFDGLPETMPPIVINWIVAHLEDVLNAVLQAQVPSQVPMLTPSDVLDSMGLTDSYSDFRRDEQTGKLQGFSMRQQKWVVI